MSSTPKTVLTLVTFGVCVLHITVFYWLMHHTHIPYLASLANNSTNNSATHLPNYQPNHQPKRHHGNVRVQTESHKPVIEIELIGLDSTGQQAVGQPKLDSRSTPIPTLKNNLSSAPANKKEPRNTLNELAPTPALFNEQGMQPINNDELVANIATYHDTDTLTTGSAFDTSTLDVNPLTIISEIDAQMRAKNQSTSQQPTSSTPKLLANSAIVSQHHTQAISSSPQVSIHPATIDSASIDDDHRIHQNTDISAQPQPQHNEENFAHYYQEQQRYSVQRYHHPTSPHPIHNNQHHTLHHADISPKVFVSHQLALTHLLVPLSLQLPNNLLDTISTQATTSWEVSINFYVDKQGRVMTTPKPMIDKSSGHPKIDAHALSVITQAKFIPFKKVEKAVIAEVTMRLVFNGN